MSHPIPLKSAFWLETEGVGCESTVLSDSTAQQQESRGDTTLVNSAWGSVYARAFVYPSEPRLFSHQSRGAAIGAATDPR